MKLKVHGLDLAANPFSSIWGWDVSGFNHQKHCQACLRGAYVPLDRALEGEELNLSNEPDYFYLCALGRPRSGSSNVQLAVKSQPGAVASVGSLYGVVFTITDAIAIRIQSLPLGWRGLDKSYTQCPNFQFGVQAYGYPTQGEDLDFGRHYKTPTSLIS